MSAIETFALLAVAEPMPVPFLKTETVAPVVQPETRTFCAAWQIGEANVGWLGVGFGVGDGAGEPPFFGPQAMKKTSKKRSEKMVFGLMKTADAFIKKEVFE